MFANCSDLTQAAETASEPMDPSLAAGKARLGRHDHLPILPDTVTLSLLLELIPLSAGGCTREDMSRRLEYAVLCGGADVVSCLLSSGADVHERSSSDATLLHTAVENGHLDVASLLLDNGADANSAGSKGRAPMHLVPAGRADIVELLVGSGSQVDIKDCNGNSALMLAVLNGQADRVRTFLGSGADVNAVEPISALMEVKDDAALPPIVVAVHMKHTGVLKVLVEHGADLRPRFTNSGRSVLHHAVATHYLEGVRCLIFAKVDIDSQTVNGNTALHYVAFYGGGAHSKEILQLLLNAGANIEAKSDVGHTPLHSAAYRGELEIVKGLLDAGASVGARSGYLRTPLHQAAVNGHLQVVQKLLNEGADIHDEDENGETAIHLACHTRCEQNLSVIKHLLGREASVLAAADRDSAGGRLPPHGAALCGFMEAVELFLDTGFDKASTDDQGWQMVHYAALGGHVDALRLLLEKGAATGCSTRLGGDCPLHLAAQGGHVEAISVLCEFGANINIRSGNRGYYPIHYAARFGHAEVISLLHKKGATIDALDNLSQTPLLYAVWQDQIQAVSLLCEYGASVNHAMRSGMHILVAAAARGRADIVSILCQKGADVQIDMDAYAFFSCASLLEAAKGNHNEVAQVLLDHGANIDVQNKEEGWTPLHNAADQGHKEMVKLLLEKGANRKVTAKDGQTARALARKKGHREVCKMLGKSQKQPKPGASDQTPDSDASTKAVHGGNQSL